MWHQSIALAIGILGATTALADNGQLTAAGFEAENNVDSLVIALKETQRTSDIVTAGGRAVLLGDLIGVSLRHSHYTAFNRQVLSLPEDMSAAAAERLAQKLVKSGLVEKAWPNYRLQPTAIPNDAMANQQWHYFESTAGINLSAALDKSSGRGSVVAVVDSGWIAHPDRPGSMLAGYDFISSTVTAQDGNGRDSNATDPGDWAPAGACGSGSAARDSSWHGTHVMGTIAARTNNGTGVAGVAPDATILPVRVLGRCGGTWSDIADGIVWASGGSIPGVPANSSHAKIINLSLGGTGSCLPDIQAAINTARSNGAVIVVSAGNNSTDTSSQLPANCSGVINVAASDRQGNRASYSNWGTLIDLAAPGGETATLANGVLSTLHSSTTTTTSGSYNYEFYQGTSMAAPHVSGVAALLISVAKMMGHTLTADQIEARLKSTVRSLAGSCMEGCGTGLLDANAAVQSEIAPGSPAIPSNVSAVTTNQCEATISWSPSAGTTSYKLFASGWGPPWLNNLIYTGAASSFAFNAPWGFGTELNVAVQACNSSGCSPFSQSKNVTGEGWQCED